MAILDEIKVEEILNPNFIYNQKITMIDNQNMTASQRRELASLKDVSLSTYNSKESATGILNDQVPSSERQ